MNYGQQGTNLRSSSPSSAAAQPSSAAVGVARAPQQQDETLYETLLRYHGEHDDSSDEVIRKAMHQQQQQPQRGRGNLKNDEDYEDPEEEDRKPPARPTASSATSSTATSQSTTKLPQHRNNSPAHSGGGVGAPSRHLPNAYQNALEESRRTAGVEPGRGERDIHGKKPGIVMVNEPAVRPDSTMYRQTYGDLAPLRSQQNRQPDNNIRVGDSSPTAVQNHAPPRPQITTTNQPSSMRSLPNSIPSPMGVQETRAALNALKQSRRGGFGSSPNSPAEPDRKARLSQSQTASVRSLPSPLGVEETRAALDAIKQSKHSQPFTSPRVGSKVDEGDDGDAPPGISAGGRRADAMNQRVGSRSPHSQQGRPVRSNFSSPGGATMAVHGPPLTSPSNHRPLVGQSPRPLPANSHLSTSAAGGSAGMQWAPLSGSPYGHHSTQRVPTGSVPITPVDDEMDEDLLLALEISKNDTGNTTASSNGSAAVMQHRATERAFFPEEERSSSLRDLLLALELSEEASKSGHHHATTSSEDSFRRQSRSTSLDALLAMEGNPGSSGYAGERVTDFVAAGISTDASKRPDEQFKILEQIREEQEKKELELALQVSQQEGRSKPPPQNVPAAKGDEDFLVSQQKAMEEWSEKASTTSSRPGLAEKQSSSRSQDSNERRRELVERGTVETQHAITAGQAHIVTCQGCKGRLQAPVTYSLVFCPKCQTISPA